MNLSMIYCCKRSILENRQIEELINEMQWSMGLEHRLLNETAEKSLMKQIYVAKTRGNQEVLKWFSKSVMIIKERDRLISRKNISHRGM